jgi:5-carboxymethyl-2-hydroxymuconate isomerase
MSIEEGAAAMPHVTIQYTANLDPEANMGVLCAALAAVIGAQRDAGGQRLFPIGGTRVMAYPAFAHAVADAAPDRAFVYLNVRIAPGRAAPLVAATGEALMAAVRSHFAALFATRPLGITLQIDEGAPVFDAKHSNLHPLFAGR